MARVESSEELLPCIDFTRARRGLRWLYVTSVVAAAMGLGALAILHTDVVVVGSAVLTPLGETARVQNAHAGTVDAILARDGDTVRKGQVIVRFDARPVQTRIDTLTAQVQAVGARVDMLDRLVQSRAAVYRMQGLISRVDRAGVQARRTAAQQLIDAREQEREIRERDQGRMRQLIAASALAKNEVENAAIRAGEATAQAEAARAALSELETARVRLTLQAELLQHDFVVAEFSDGAELAEARAELVRLQGELAAARVERDQLEITAPRSGVVQGLAVLDRGDVVGPASTLGYVVPSAGALVVKTTVTTGGIAFIWPKQTVRIKLDAYPFEDFGVFRGYVERVARDTAPPEQGGRRGVAYDVQVVITSQPPRSAGHTLALRPGMTGQAEFTVRREPVLAALLRPVRGTFDSVHH